MATRGIVIAPVEVGGRRREVWVPDAYHVAGVEHLVGNRAAGLLADPGLGKTSMTIKALQALKKAGLLKGALILAPKRPTVLVWPPELDKWDIGAGLTYELLTAGAKARAVHRKADVYLMNYEGLPWLCEGGNNSLMRAMLRAKRINVLVFDELTKMKANGTERFRQLDPWLKFFDYRWGLTGSFAAGGLETVFRQVYMLDSGATLGTLFTAFRRKYFLPVPNTREWVPTPMASKQITARIAPLMLRLDADDHLNLPKLIVNTVKFELPPKVQRIYDTLISRGEVELPDGTLIAPPNAGVMSSYLRQIATGFCYKPRITDPFEPDYDPGGTEKQYVHLHNERYAATEDFLEEVGPKPALISFIFIQELRAYFKYIKGEHPVIGGGGRTLNNKDLMKMQNDWNAGRHIRMMGNPASVAHGLNLQGCAAEHVVFMSTPWGVERVQQYEARLRRRGTKAKKIVATRFVCRDTIDEWVVTKLARGIRVQDLVHQYIKSTGASARIKPTKRTHVVSLKPPIRK